MRRRIRNYVELCRISNLPTVLTNVLCGLVLSGAAISLPRSLAAALAVSCLYSGGMCLNDLLDVSEDRVLRPQRPLPSGRIPLLHAWLFTFLLFAAALLLLFALPGWRPVFGGAVLSISIVLYDTLHQRHPATVLLLGACRALAIIVASLSAAGTAGGAVLLAATVQALYVVALSVVARWEKKSLRRPILPVPWLLAGIAIVDGALMALLAHPAWLLVGLLGAAATAIAQREVRGD